jgi:hypothetical protein
MVTQHLVDLGVPGHRPHAVTLKEDHGAGLPKPIMERVGVTPEILGERVNVQDWDFNRHGMRHNNSIGRRGGNVNIH